MADIGEKCACNYSFKKLQKLYEQSCVGSSTLACYFFVVEYYFIKCLNLFLWFQIISNCLYITKYDVYNTMTWSGYLGWKKLFFDTLNLYQQINLLFNLLKIIINIDRNCARAGAHTYFVSWYLHCIFNNIDVSSVTCTNSGHMIMRFFPNVRLHVTWFIFSRTAQSIRHGADINMSWTWKQKWRLMLQNWEVYIVHTIEESWSVFLNFYCSNVNFARWSIFQSCINLYTIKRTKIGH